MDIADRTQQDMEAYETHRQVSNELEVQPTGVCLTCGESLEPGRRWCSPECRDEWEREQERKKRR